MLPPIRHRISIRHKYDSPTLGVIVSLVGIVTLIPYLVLRLWAWASLCRLPVTARFPRAQRCGPALQWQRPT